MKLNSQTDRKIISTFRTSSHDLEIEKGRYNGTKSEDRICQVCKNSVEDELNFLLKCRSLKDVRSPHVNKLASHFPNLSKLSDDMKFIWIMSSEDLRVISILSTLLKSLFDKRKEILNRKID